MKTYDPVNISVTYKGVELHPMFPEEYTIEEDNMSEDKKKSLEEYIQLGVTDKEAVTQKDNEKKHKSLILGETIDACVTATGLERADIKAMVDAAYEKKHNYAKFCKKMDQVSEVYSVVGGITLR